MLSKYKELKLWEDQIYIYEDFSKFAVEEKENLFKRKKEIMERDKFARVFYIRLVLY